MFLSIICGIYGKITIHGPDSLKNMFKDSDYTIEVVYSNYGRIPYGQSIVSFIWYHVLIIWRVFVF